MSPGAGSPPSPPPPSLSPPSTLPSAGAGGNLAASMSRHSPPVRGGFSPSSRRSCSLRQGPGETSPLSCRDIRPRSVVVPLRVLVARVPLRDPRGRPRLPLVLLPPSTAPVDMDAVALDVAGMTLGCVGGAGECPGAVASLSSAVRKFPVATKTAPPGSVCSLPPGSPSDARVAPSDGVTPAAKGSLSCAGPTAAVGEGGSSFLASNTFWDPRIPRCRREQRKRLPLFLRISDLEGPPR